MFLPYRQKTQQFLKLPTVTFLLYSPFYFHFPPFFSHNGARATMRCQALYLAAWCTITSVAAGLDWHSLSQVDPAQDVVPRVVTLSKAPTEPADAGSGFTSFDLWSGLETDASLQTVVSAFADDLTCSYDPVTGFVLGLGLGGRTACTLGAARVTIPLSAGGYVSGLSIAPAATPPQVTGGGKGEREREKEATAGFGVFAHCPPPQTVRIDRQTCV